MKEEKNTNQKQKIFSLSRRQEFFLYCFVSTIVFASSFFLFYKQAFIGVDLPVHIDFALNGSSYSVNSLFLRWSYKLIGGEFGCALYLAIVMVLTLFASTYLLKTCITDTGKDISFAHCFLPGTALCFIGCIFFPYLNERFYLGTYFTQPWHNSTYLLMRLFGLLTVAVYIKIRKHYLTDGITFKEWFVFFVLLLLTNAAKPNFIIFFAPAMLCELIYDFVKTRAKKAKQIVAFGMAVLCSLPILYFQFGELYPSEAEEPSEIFITAKYFLEFLTAKNIISHLLTFMPFLLFVTILCIVKKCVNRNLIFGWLMFLFAYAEKWFIYESGPRLTHGNFGWGLIFAGLILSIICVERLWFLKKQIKKPVFMSATAILEVMLISGFLYFIIVLVTGKSLF